MKREFLPVTGTALALAGLLFTGLANAALTPVLPNPGGEPDLAEHGGILDRYFGLNNLTRVDDDIDKYWENNGTVRIKTLGKWAGFRQSFGYIDTDNNFTSLFNVNKSHSRPRAHIHAEDSGSVFRFGLDPSGAPLWSSDPADNGDLLDHMVTWRINTAESERHHADFVIAWEDLHGGGDQDFNDLVLLVGGDVGLHAAVPVPAALLLFGSGILGLATVARRKSHQGTSD